MDKWFLKLYAKRSQKLSPAALDEQLFEFYEDGFRVVSGNSTDGFGALQPHCVPGPHR